MTDAPTTPDAAPSLDPDTAAEASAFLHRIATMIRRGVDAAEAKGWRRVRIVAHGTGGRVVDRTLVLPRTRRRHGSKEPEERVRLFALETMRRITTLGEFSIRVEALP